MVHTFAWPRGQNFGLGLLTYGLGLDLLVSALRQKLSLGQNCGLVWPQGQSFCLPGLNNKILALAS